MVTELDRLREENELLRLRVDELEQIMLRPELPLCLKITRRQSQVLGLLLARPVVSTADAMTALYELGTGDPPNDTIVSVLVCHLRRRLKPFGINIETLWGRGYRLPPEDKERLWGLE
jgi:two-component system cell cycle response regulator CtrA